MQEQLYYMDRLLNSEDMHRLERNDTVVSSTSVDNLLMYNLIILIISITFYIRYIKYALMDVQH